MKRYILTLFFAAVCAHARFQMGPPDPREIQDSIQGSVIGAALGDAFGKPTEFMNSVDEQYDRYPHGIRGFEDFKQDDFVNGAPVYTDDTAMSIVTLKTLIQSQEQNKTLEHTMSDLARAYVRDMDVRDGWAAPYRAPGNTCLANVQKLKTILQKDSAPWRVSKRWWAVSTSDQGGCGSVMRAHPFGLMFYKDPKKAAEWAAEHSNITHGAPMARAACGCYGNGCCVCGAL